MRTVRVEKVAKAANTHCILESWLILSLLNVALSGTHSRVKGISPNHTIQAGRAIGLSWTAMTQDGSIIRLFLPNPSKHLKERFRGQGECRKSTFCTPEALVPMGRGSV